METNKWKKIKSSGSFKRKVSANHSKILNSSLTKNESEQQPNISPEIIHHDENPNERIPGPPASTEPAQITQQISSSPENQFDQPDALEDYPSESEKEFEKEPFDS